MKDTILSRLAHASHQVSGKAGELHSTSVIRLVSMLAIEANDEWLVGRSYISQKSMSTLLTPRPEEKPPINEEKEVELLAA